VGHEVRSIQIFSFYNPTDIDWEYPNYDKKNPQDKENFVSLLQTIKQTIGSDFILSVALGSGFWRTNLSYDIPSMFEAVDFVNLMSYNLHGGWENITGIHGALYRSALDPTDKNVDAALRLLVDQGVSKEKIIMGIRANGNVFTLADPNQNGVGAPATGAGSWRFNDICQRTNANSLTYVWDDDQKVPYAYSGSSWVGYDDVKSVTIKAQYINNSGLGGVMIWNIDSDDYSGACGLGKYPLISAIYQSVVGLDFEVDSSTESQCSLRSYLHSNSNE
jgi:chitinase